MKIKLKQNIGMSVNFAVDDITQKGKEIKLLNRRISIENKEMKLEMELKSK